MLPGAAERILAMAERESGHRQAMERSESKLSFTGLIAGATVAIAALAAGTGVIFLGHEIAGTVIVGIDLVGLAGIFVYGSRTYRRDGLEEGLEPDS